MSIIKSNAKEVMKANIVTTSISIPDHVLYKYDGELQSIQHQLIDGSLDTSATLDKNGDYLRLILDIVNKLPRLPEIKQQKLVIPEFDEIEVLKSDSPEIKKFIRKVNYKYISYSCEHKVEDEQSEAAVKNVSSLINSKAYQKYQQFIKDMASLVSSIRSEDKMRSRLWNDKILLPSAADIQEICNYGIELTGEIMTYNSKQCPTCSKCKGVIRGYEYCVREVQRMRDELDEQRNEPAEVKNSLGNLMAKHYPTTSDILLSEIKQKYKEEYGLTKTFDQLMKEFEPLKEFKISRIHNVYHVKRMG